MNIEYFYKPHIDLIYHILAHIKVNNASDLYSSTYVKKMEKLQCNTTLVVPDKLIEYYNQNFDKLAYRQKNHFIRSGFSVIFAVFHGELYAPSVRDICFASDIPEGVRGEYNITKSEGFYITFCVAKYITPSKTEYH